MYNFGKYLVIIFAIYFFPMQVYSQRSIYGLQPQKISFNYDVNSSEFDAVSIKKDINTNITSPEYDRLGIKNDEFAYVKGLNNPIIKVQFSTLTTNVNYLVKATVVSGEGIGNVCEFFVNACDASTKTYTVKLDGAVPSTIGKRTFTWKWEVTAIPTTTPYCTVSCADFYTSHTYYTLYDVPKEPEIQPRLEILDYACLCSYGDNTIDDICNDILANDDLQVGFKYDYYYVTGHDCSFLSSDFVRIISSLGIVSNLHLWSAIFYPNVSYGDMTKMCTNEILLLGYTESEEYLFGYHQWVQVGAIQIDPSTLFAMEEDFWGAYEDFLFKKYKSSGSVYWQNNYVGQLIGCEAPEHRMYSDIGELQDWAGPNVNY